MEEVGREGGLCIIRCPKVALKKVNEFTIVSWNCGVIVVDE